MTPPPTTTIFFGIDESSSAPVEVTIVFSSTGTPLSFAGSEPVAMTMSLQDRSIAAPPSIGWSLTEPVPLISPVPLKYVTPYFLNSPSMPLVSPVTVFDLCCISLSRSILTLSAEMPCGPQPLAASS